LVNDLLDVSKLEAGAMPVNYSRINLKTVVQDGLSMLEQWAESRGIKLESKLTETFEFDADEKLLQIVFTNLVGNAIKFSTSGGLIVISAEQSETEIKICVSDTGCVIPEISKKKIFEKFEQVKTISQDGVPKGTGLGLSIVKEIVELHKGKIWVQSKVGKGSKFIFTLPINADSN
ncbi:MAG: hypothetical protein DRP78_06050, partial [Candidatus Omnitrophota bacterium]